jgi:hypothetical protein
MSPDERARDDAPAPLLGSWRRWYTVVLLTTAGLVALFWWLSVHFA